VFLEASTNNIRRRVAVVGSVLIVAPMVVLGLAVWAVTQRFGQPPPLYKTRHSAANLTELTRNLAGICRKYQQESLDKLRRGQTILDAAGRIRLDGNQRELWHARNEVTGQAKWTELPLLAAGDVKFVSVMDFNQPAPVVDEIAKVAGTPATIFERMNERGDMLRVSSSLEGEAGRRAIGSYIPADAPDSNPARALREVLAGKSYIGKERNGMVTYLTSYQPLKNTLGNVVGMLSTALPEEQIRTELKPLVTARAEVDQPELFIVEATGESRGTALAMGNRSLEGNDLWNEKDLSGRPYVQELCSRALKLAPGEFADYQYQQPTPISGLSRTVTARFTYIPELDWVVGFAQPESEALATEPPMLGLAPWALWLWLGVGLAGTGLAVRMWLKFSDNLANKLSSSLRLLKSDAKQLGDAAAELALASSSTRTVRARAAVPPAVADIFGKAGRMIEEIRLALQHIDASGESVIGMIGAIDQITFATNLLMVNAAIQASNFPGNEPISGVADELRALAEQCRKAARATKAEIEQSRAELEKGNREVLQLVKDLRSEQSPAGQPPDDIALLLRRQADTLLQLARGIDQTAETITADFGVNAESESRV